MAGFSGRWSRDFEGLNDALRSEVPRLAHAGLTPEQLALIGTQLFDTHFPRPHDPEEIDAAKATVAAARDELAALHEKRNRLPRYRVHSKADPEFRPDPLSRAVGMVAAACATIALATVPLMAAANLGALKSAPIFADQPLLLLPFGFVQLGLAFGAIALRETLHLESSRRIFDRTMAFGGGLAFFALASSTLAVETFTPHAATPGLGVETDLEALSQPGGHGASAGLSFLLISVADFFGVGLLHGLVRNNVFPLTDERVLPSVEREFIDNVAIPAAEGRFASAQRDLREMNNAFASWESDRQQFSARFKGEVALTIAHSNAVAEAARLHALRERNGGGTTRAIEGNNPAAWMNGHAPQNAAENAKPN